MYASTKALEHSDHAEHLAHGHANDDHSRHDVQAAVHERGNQMAALLVAVLAAALAVTEQGAKHAEIRVQESSIFATDAWAQYQAKSTRGTMTKEFAGMIAVLGAGDATLMDQRGVLLDQLREAQERFESDSLDGKAAIAKRARAFEAERELSLEQTHAYHNGAAAMELGIVLATASAIIKAKLLILMALGIGITGIVFAILGLVAPELGAM
jgi:hypothetical protein